MKAEHQIRTIMAYRAAGARFYVGGGKWATVAGSNRKRFYAKHYLAARKLERPLKDFRRKKRDKGRVRPYMHDLLEGIRPNIQRAFAQIKKAIKR